MFVKGVGNGCLGFGDGAPRFGDDHRYPPPKAKNDAFCNVLAGQGYVNAKKCREERGFPVMREKTSQNARLSAVGHRGNIAKRLL